MKYRDAFALKISENSNNNNDNKEIIVVLAIYFKFCATLL